MAKQTFTTGQVLTAAQMTSLQQTAMGGGSTTAKTANYVLVAADAGTTVAMNAAGATTITVNTGLFAAGDTVFIQNIGAGACTITAGTATVNTAGSLILPQYDAGILYFTSPSAAIFYDYIQVGATSPLTTKGDLYVYGTSDTRLGVGANGTTLVADSAEATGLKWATPASGGMTLLSTTTLSGSSTTISNISQSYKALKILIRDADCTAVSEIFAIRLNGVTTTSYRDQAVFGSDASAGGYGGDRTYIYYGLTTTSEDYDKKHRGEIYIERYAETEYKHIVFNSYQNAGSFRAHFGAAAFDSTTAISSITLFPTSPGTWNSGTVYIYGVS